jgi:sigma-B regulation protein RsbU (phosphoserine phosphatase)
MSVRITDDPWGNLPQFILVVSLTVLAVIAIRAGSDRLRIWVDRRFFREAYNTELLLTTLAERVTDLHSEHEVVETVCETISSSLHVPAVGAFLQPGTPGHQQEAELAYGTSAGVELFRTKRIPMEAASEDGRAKLHSHDLGAELLVAIPGRHARLGLLALGPKRSEAAYSRADLQLLNTVARQTGMAIENSRLAETVAHQLAQRELFDREIQLARSIQQRLLPVRLPAIEGFAFAGICEPAQSVGGDYFDFIPLPQGRIAFAIGDVSGKGIPAALLMASLQASLRGLLAGEIFASGSTPDLAVLMAKLNALIYDATPASRFVTLLLGILDTQTGEVSLANAGHCPALLGRQPSSSRGKELIQSSARGPALGLRREATYPTETLQLQPGDLLLAYTDGVSEAMNPDREEFGDEAVRQFTVSLNGTSARAAIEDLRREVHRFAAGAPQHDDLTAIAVATASV